MKQKAEFESEKVHQLHLDGTRSPSQNEFTGSSLGHLLIVCPNNLRLERRLNFPGQNSSPISVRSSRST